MAIGKNYQQMSSQKKKICINWHKAAKEVEKEPNQLSNKRADVWSADCKKTQKKHTSEADKNKKNKKIRKKEKNIYKDHRIESCLQQALYIIMYRTLFFYTGPNTDNWPVCGSQEIRHCRGSSRGSTWSMKDE